MDSQYGIALTSAMPDFKKWSSCRILGFVDETPRVRTFRVEPPQGQPWSFLPGQFIQLRFPDNTRAIRAYSLASSPLERGYFEISFERAGSFTQKLFSLDSGSRIEIRGPFGKFVYRESLAHAVLIAGGAGIAPYRSFIRYVLDKALSNKLTLIYSVRSPSDIIYHQELLAISEANPHIQFYCTITKPDGTLAGNVWNGHTGRVTVPYLKDVVVNFAAAFYYLCGSNRFVYDLSSLLRASGIPERQIDFEKWGDF